MQIVERSDENGTRNKSSRKQGIVSDSERPIQTSDLRNDPHGEFSEPWSHLRALSQGPRPTTVTSSDVTYTCRPAMLVNHQIDALTKMVNNSTEQPPSKCSTRTLDRAVIHRPISTSHSAFGGSRKSCHNRAELDCWQRSCRRSKHLDLECYQRKAADSYSDDKSLAAMTSIPSSSALLVDKDLSGIGHWCLDKPSEARAECLELLDGACVDGVRVI